MSTVTSIQHAQPVFAGSYAHKVGRAALALLAALVAIKPRQKDDASSEQELHALANRYEAVMPNLAAELHFIASRG